MTLREFEELLSPLLPTPLPKRVAIAVSSGADSLCLAFLMSQWGQKTGCEILALTVQHEPDVFPEEATFPARTLPKWGIKHTVLPIPPLPQTGIQARSRQARYQALSLFCHTHGIRHLCLAHHQDDQLETWTIRLTSGSGNRGLSGMLPTTFYQGITLLRPFLTIPKQWLRQTLCAHHIAWLEDPSNNDPQFRRTRLRIPLQKISPEERIFWFKEIQTHQDKRLKIEEGLHREFQRCCTLNSKGWICVNEELWRSYGRDMQRLVLEKILQMVGGQQIRPLSRMSLDRTVQSIQTPSFRRTTLGGCLIEKIPGGFRFIREWQRIQPIQPIQKQHFIWDSRWYITLSEMQPRLTIRPQGLKAGLLSAHLPEIFQQNTPLDPDRQLLKHMRWVWSETPLFISGAMNPISGKNKRFAPHMPQALFPQGLP